MPGQVTYTCELMCYAVGVQLCARRVSSREPPTSTQQMPDAGTAAWSQHAWMYPPVITFVMKCIHGTALEAWELYAEYWSHTDPD
jgi:hypothetical protein